MSIRESLSSEAIAALRERLRDDKPVRRRLAPAGRLHVDRQLPFLCVHRRPPDDREKATARLVSGHASYLLAPGEAALRRSVARIVDAVVETLAAPFGAFLLLEIWRGQAGPQDGARFRLIVPLDNDSSSFVESFQTELSRLRIGAERVQVRVVPARRPAPPGMTPLLSPSRAGELGCIVLGLEVPPVYLDPERGTEFPEVLRKLRRSLTPALQRVFHHFSCSHTTRCPVNHHMLGRRAVVKAVWEVDEQLSRIEERFDFLLQVTPSNAAGAWQAFRRAGFSRAPVFRYRPLPFDPFRLKRRLWSIPIERVEDPTLSDLFRQKQDELDRMITLLLDIETRGFVHGASQIFGEVDDGLLALAKRVLGLCPVSRTDDSSGGSVDAAAFAARARAELDYFREQWQGVDATVSIRDDVTRGLMVSKGSLIIGAGTRIPAGRVDALLQHEVGTHVLTFYNGKAQRFRQLRSGLAGYDPLQEGLAVLAEYLVGGLTAGRLRLLAARVVGVHAMLGGGRLVDVHRMLTAGYGFAPRTAFTIAMRIFRGGGLTKDAAYLRGLAELLVYLGRRGALEPLLIGKIATDHLPIVRELLLREVLRPAVLRPRYLDDPAARDRLKQVRAGKSVEDLLQG